MTVAQESGKSVVDGLTGGSAQSNRASDGGNDLLGVLNRGEVNGNDAIGESGRKTAGDS